MFASLGNLPERRPPADSGRLLILRYYAAAYKISEFPEITGSEDVNPSNYTFNPTSRCTTATLSRSSRAVPPPTTLTKCHPAPGLLSPRRVFIYIPPSIRPLPLANSTSGFLHDCLGPYITVVTLHLRHLFSVHPLQL